MSSEVKKAQVRNPFKTREINQAVKNNPNKFSNGYIIELTSKEWESVKSKFLASHRGGCKVKLPKAFTQKGLYMLATILKGEKAIQSTIAIIEEFAMMRNLSRNMKELSIVIDENKEKDIIHRRGEIFLEILARI
jgi:phage regulator Rha-like protein